MALFPIVQFLKIFTDNYCDLSNHNLWMLYGLLTHVTSSIHENPANISWCVSLVILMHAGHVRPKMNWVWVRTWNRIIERSQSQHLMKVYNIIAHTREIQSLGHWIIDNEKGNSIEAKHLASVSEGTQCSSGIVDIAINRCLTRALVHFSWLPCTYICSLLQDTNVRWAH